MRLGSCTWPDLERCTPPRLLVPLGATEQHGPHLPLCTDTLIASAVADGAARDDPSLVVAPALPYGASGEHAGFPGTLSLGLKATEVALVELVRSADHFADVVLVSWHGGNVEAVTDAVAKSRADGRDVSCWQPNLPNDADAHAGWVETSLMLAIAPELVRDERPAGAPEPVVTLMPSLRRRGVKAVSPSGVLGDARQASIGAGRDLLADLVTDLSNFLETTRPVWVFA